MSDVYLVPMPIIEAIKEYGARFVNADTEQKADDALKICIQKIEKEFLPTAEAFKFATSEISAQEIENRLLKTELQACHDRIHSMMLEMNEIRNVDTMRFLNRVSEFLI